MLETPHAIVAAAIATRIPNPLVSLPLALASHFILEKVPHWNPHLNTETEKYGKPTRQSTIITTIDSTLALIGGSYFALKAMPDIGHSLTILAACFVSVLPDVVEAPYFFLNYRKTIIKRWIKFQKSLQVDYPIIPGLLTQLAVTATAVYFALSR